MKTLHYSENHEYFPGYVMFSYFSFTDGKLNIGQSESVKVEDLKIVREALARNRRTLATYRYVNGRPELVQ